jgi:glucokinase
MALALIAEIAPNMCRFALLHDEGAERPVFSHHVELTVADHDGVEAAFAYYLATIDQPWPKILGMALAAPVQGDAFTLPQSGWSSSFGRLQAAFGFERIFHLNRAGASAISLAWLGQGEALPIGSATPLPSNLPAGCYAVIGADFGLGVSGVTIDDAGKCTVLATEAGHMSYAPTNDLEIDLLKRLTTKFGRVSYERLISWPGLAEIFEAVCAQQGVEARKITPLEIVLYARTGADPLCVSALNRFCEILGDFAGDVAMAVGATEGVFLTGRFILEARDAMSGSHFRDRFESKGRLSGMVRAIPTWAMTSRTSVLTGMAKHVVDRLREDGDDRLAPVAPAQALTVQDADTLDHVAGAILGGIDVGVLVLDADLRIVSSNDSFWMGSSVPRRLYAAGKPAKPCFEAMAAGGGLTPEMLKRVLSGLDGGLPFASERTAFGGAYLRDEARPDGNGGWVITAHDITVSHRRALELEEITLDLRAAKAAADSANVAKTAFLATMSHEIRTPLNGVLGMAQAMAGGELPPQQAERLEIIRQSGENLLAILNDILDLSKIEAGKLELEEVEFDLDQLLMGAHSTFTAVANKKGLSFCLATEPESHGTYLGDPTRLRQILYNLVSNAIKFTATGEVRVSTAYDGKMLSMKVKDTGIGIPQDRIDSLFDKFTQVDASTTRQFGGTGLGLSICLNLAEMMGGAIKVTSVLGEGTTFELAIPITRTGDGQAQPAFSGPVEESQESVGDLRVLAAEDNRVNQLVLKTLLQQMGVEVTVVDDGEEALAAWRREPWDIILMDVQMPRMDGPTAVQHIRRAELAEGRARTPIIALTANVMSHQVNEYLGAGMDACVGKPLQITALMQAMNDVLEAAEPQPQAAVG